MESSQNHHRLDLVIPIEKFSYSSSPPEASKFNWTHESRRDDLYLVFRTQPSTQNSQNECLMMNVFAGGNVLEHQDVHKLVDMAQKFDLMMTTMGLNSSHAQAPVQIVVKRPCFAMRYTKDPTQVQRIQIRFKGDEDYDKCLDVFRNLGLPIRDAPQATASATAASSSGPIGQRAEVAPPNPVPTPMLCTTPMSHLYAPQQHVQNVERNSFDSNQRMMDPIRPVLSTSKPTETPVQRPKPMPYLYTSQMMRQNAELGGFNSLDSPRSASSETIRPSSAASPIMLRSDYLRDTFSSFTSPTTSISSNPTAASALVAKPVTESSFFVAQSLKAQGDGSPAELSGLVTRKPLPQPPVFSESSQISPSLNNRSSFVPPTFEGNASSLNARSKEVGAKPMSSIYISQMQNQEPFQEARSPPPSSLGLSNSKSATVYKEHSASLNQNAKQDSSNPSFYVSQMLRQEPPQNSGAVHTDLLPHATTPSITTDSTPVLSPHQDPLKLSRSLTNFSPSPSKSMFLSSPMMRTTSYPASPLQPQNLPRPQSVPSIMPVNKADWMPPKRELPFLKPRKDPKSLLPSVAKGAEEPSPVVGKKQTSSEVQKAPKKITPKRVAQRNTKKAVVQEKTGALVPSSPVQTKNPASDPEGIPPVSESSTVSDKGTSKKRPADDDEQVSSKRAKMIDASTQTQTSSDHDHRVMSQTAAISSLGGLGNEIDVVEIQPPAHAPAVLTSPPIPAPANILDQIDNFVAKHKDRPSPNPIADPWTTPRYADATEQERGRMVNDWICDNLENEDFLKLCEDVGGSWRRIGLGF